MKGIGNRHKNVGQRHRCNRVAGSILIILVLTTVLGIGVGVSGRQADDNRIPVIIRFRGGPDTDLVESHKGVIKRVFKIAPAIAAEIPEVAIAGLARAPSVAYIEPDHQVKELDQVLPWGVDRIEADKAHAGPFPNKGNGVQVAIVDSGVDYNHPDLAANYAGGYDFVNGDLDPMDDRGHGTHCAGIVAGLDNEIGVVGVAPEADIYALKVLDFTGTGLSSWVAAAIEWAVLGPDQIEGNEDDAEIVSMSLGSDYGSSLVKEVCDYAFTHGTLPVAAAGNDGNPGGGGDKVDYPARYDSVIAVAATNQYDHRAVWGNSGSSTGPAVELAAPGDAIYSTYWDDTYTTRSGTSMACPHVSGTAALMIAADPLLRDDPQGVRDRLRDTATDLGTPGRDTWYGHGLVDASPATGPADTDPPGQVKDLAVTPFTSSQLDLSWTINPETDLHHYIVYRTQTSGSGHVMVSRPTTNSYSDTGLEPSTTYYYQVSAVDASGNEGVPSTEVSGTTEKAPQGQTMQVQSIQMSQGKKAAGPNRFIWAMVTITVASVDSRAPLEGAVVYGHWELATTGSDSDITGPNGQAKFRSRSIKNPFPGTTFRFVVDDIELQGWIYDPEVPDMGEIIV